MCRHDRFNLFKHRFSSIEDEDLIALALLEKQWATKIITNFLPCQGAAFMILYCGAFWINNAAM